MREYGVCGLSGVQVEEGYAPADKQGAVGRGGV